MKLLSVVILLLASAIMQTQAENSPGQTQVDLPAPTPYAIVNQDANSRAWERTTYETSASGDVIPHVHSYTEMATGLNHLQDGQWMESKEEIDLLANGGAAATNGQHQVYFPGDIYNGQIELITPDGVHLHSRPMGLSYDDGTNTVLIAQLTNSIGYLVGANQVIYPDAFTGLKADIRYTYTKGGFEQDVILKEQPLTPESFGLNPDTARLEVLTEFFDPPQPDIQPMTASTVAGDLEDDTLSFGEMTMGQGKAFLVGAADIKVPVNKQWLQLDARQFLIEEVPVNAIVDELLQLPEPSAAVQTSRHYSPLSVVSTKRLLPAQHLARTISNKPMQMIRASAPSKGLVLDYVSMITQTNYTFQGDTTYYLSGTVNLSGTNIFEGGTVLKYANNASLNFSFPAQINSEAAAYRPAIFTAKDDNSVGDTISGSTGSPNYCANPALNLVNGTFSLSYFRIAWAKVAINAVSSIGNFYHGQLVNCVSGIRWQYDNAYLRNTLFANVQTNFYIYTAGINAQNTTFSSSDYLIIFNFGGGLTLTNCILANLAHLTNGFASTTLSGDHNGFYNSPVFGTGQITNTFYPFQTVGAGNYYLTNGCAFTNAGTTVIDPTLLASLTQRTTYPPILYSNVIFTTNLTLTPQAQRDTDTPDLGYHYDPIDYLVDYFQITNAVLTITNGAAIGCYNDSLDIWLQDGSSIASVGSPLYPNWIVRYSSVQEQPMSLGPLSPSMAASVSPYHLNAVTSGGQYRFTKFACPAGGGSHLYHTGGSWAYTNLLVQDCEFWGGGSLFGGGSSNAVAILKNNLFARSTFSASSGAGSHLYLTNNLFWGCSLVSIKPLGAGGWYAYDNAFDSCTNIVSGTPGITNSGYNAYINCGTNRLNPTNLFDIVLTNTLTYQTGALGTFYQPNNSPLINMGSTTANLVGLYHYTVTTNEMVEGNSTVSIGYHYVATDTNGIPLDSNGDGIPDYLADANGNGVDDPSEIPWNLPLTSLKLWLKADTGVTNTAGAISAWGDQSGNMNNAGQSTGGNQPTYVTNTINGYPVVRFNGTNSYFNFNAGNFMSAATGGEALAVVKVSDPTNGGHPLWEMGGSPYYTSYSQDSYGVCEAFGSTADYNVGVPAQPMTQYHVYEVTSQSNTWASWMNGILLYQTTNNTVSWSRGITLGYGNSGNAGNKYFAGDIAEVLVFNRGLTTIERTTANQYLNLKYGLVAAIPPSPTNLIVTAISQTQIGLTWNELLTNGGATQISIERSVTSNGVFSVAAQIPNALSYVDTNLTAGTTYYYRVRAINLTTWSLYSNETNATTFTTGSDIPFSNLALWLTADRGLLQGSTNTLISYWTDQTGNGNNANQWSSVNQPVWVPNVIGSRPIIRFNGTNSYFNFNAGNFMSAATGGEALAVVKVSDPTNGGHPLWEMGGSPYYTSYSQDSYGVCEAFGSIVDYNVGVPAQPMTQYHVYEVTSQSNTWASWMNGILLYQTNNNTVSWSRGITLGYGNSGNGGNKYFAGDIAEVLVFNRGLTVDEKVAVGDYLFLKYNLYPYATNTSLPTAPTNLVGTGVSPSQLNLKWTQTSTNETGFDIERKVGAGGSYYQIGSVVEGVTNFSDSTVYYTNQYFYRVKAENYFGQSGYSIEISPPVVSLTILSTNAYITVSSTNFLSVQALDADNSVNQVTIVNNLNSDIIIGAAMSAPYTNTWIPYFQETYSFTATAADIAGNSWFSPPLSITVYLDSNGDGIPDYVQVMQGNDPINPWIPPAGDTNTTPPNINLVIPANATLIP